MTTTSSPDRCCSWRRAHGIALVIAGLIAAPASFPLHADTLTIDFEGLADSTPVTTQFSNVVFSNATAISAGISLNEFEFPPRSGTNVVFDDGGPMSILFTSLVFDFTGYFTYLMPITLEAFDVNSNFVASLTSQFSSNLGLSGDPGSLPNELFQLSYAPGIAQVTITGDPFGGSFTLDDVTVVTAIPEPSSGILFLTGAASFLLAGRKRKR